MSPELFAAELAAIPCRLRRGWPGHNVVAWHRRGAAPTLVAAPPLCDDGESRSALLAYARAGGRDRRGRLRRHLLRVTPDLFAVGGESEADPDLATAAAPLAAALASGGGILHLHHNRRRLLVIKEDPWGLRHVAAHARLVAEPRIRESLARLPGLDFDPDLQMVDLVRELSRLLIAQEAAFSRDREREPGIGHDFDLGACLAELHRRHFPEAPLPRIRWARRTGDRVLRSIRFGSYYPEGTEIRIHPRCAQPWVARVFVEHVVHHELCHHRQAQDPRPGEPPHSPRFRAWERAYLHYHRARAWEKRNLERLLAGS